MAGSITEKLKNIGPGALVAAGFVGPGTVTTCTVSGASYGYTMLWALLFATVATIIFQEMAARIGIVTQEGLGENIRDQHFASGAEVDCNRDCYHRHLHRQHRL